MYNSTSVQFHIKLTSCLLKQAKGIQFLITFVHAPCSTIQVYNLSYIIYDFLFTIVSYASFLFFFFFSDLDRWMNFLSDMEPSLSIHQLFFISSFIFASQQDAKQYLSLFHHKNVFTKCRLEKLYTLKHSYGGHTKPCIL